MTWEDLLELLKAQEGDHLKKKVDVYVGDTFYELSLVQDLHNGTLTFISARGEEEDGEEEGAK